MNYADYFPINFDSLCIKLIEYTGDENNSDLTKALHRAKQTHTHLAEFRKQLTSDDQGCMRSETDDVLYALTQYEEFCTSPNTSRLNLKDAYIFAKYIVEGAKSIHQYAKSIQ